MDPACCALCGRERPLTFHHLVPRKLHGRRRIKARFDAASLRSGVDLCGDCHRAVHRFIDHQALADAYHTLDALRAHPDVARFVDWVRRQDGRTTRVARRRLG